MPAVVHEFTFWSARQVEVAHEHLLRIALAVWPPFIIAAPWIVGFLIMGTWSAAQMRAAVFVIAATFVAISGVLGMVIDGAIVTVVRRRRCHRLTPLMSLVSGAIVAFPPVGPVERLLVAIAVAAPARIDHTDLQVHLKSNSRYSVG